MDAENDDGWQNDASEGDVAGPEEQPQTAVPEGRRVIRKRTKGKSPRETLYLKRREILREMEYAESEDGDGESTGPLNVRQQVERLKEARKSDEPLEEGWGNTRQRRRGAKWILLVVVLVGLPLVALIVSMSISGRQGTGGNPVAGVGSGMFDMPDGPGLAYDPTTPEAWFYENSVEAFDESMRVLSEINELEDPAAMEGFLRDAELTLPVVKQEWTGKESAFFVDDPRRLAWEFGGAGDTGFMAVSGRLENHKKFRAYFVKTDDGLKMDWKATMAWSEIPVGELVAQAPKQPTLVRCWVGKQPDYDMFEGHGSLYSWYQILDPTKEEFVWAHVPAGSKRDVQLKELLNYGMIVMQRRDEVRVILRIVKPTLGFRETEFEILEVVTEDWVMP